MNRIVVLAGIVFTMGACSSETKTETVSESVELKFKPVSGYDYDMEYSYEVKYDSTGEGTKFTINASHEIVSVNDDKIVIHCKHNSIVMEGKIEGKQVKLEAGKDVNDSSKASVVAAGVFSFKDRTTEFTYSPMARKLKETLLDNDSLPQNLAAESKIQFLVSYPDKPVKVGDSWENETDLKIANKKIKKATYILKAINENEAIISIEGKMDGDGEKYGQEFSIEGDFKGECAVDLKTGWQKSGNLQIAFVLHMAGKKTPMHQYITFVQK